MLALKQKYDGAAREAGRSLSFRKNAWTKEEDAMVVERRQQGQSAAKIALTLPGRTAGAIQRRWEAVGPRTEAGALLRKSKEPKSE